VIRREFITLLGGGPRAPCKWERRDKRSAVVLSGSSTPTPLGPSWERVEKPPGTRLRSQFELPNGATVTPRVPPRSMNCCTAPEALASSTNSLT